jgi:hypothetical protein
MIVVMAFALLWSRSLSLSQSSSDDAAVTASEVLPVLNHASHHEDTGGSEGIPPLILSLGTAWR